MREPASDLDSPASGVRQTIHHLVNRTEVHHGQEKRTSRLAAGVVYLSRIPPHMRPEKLRQLLQQYGEINRLYLAPEDPVVRKKRRQMTGSKGKKFHEGWVEFRDKKIAKKVAAMLNGSPIGGKVRSDHYYDLWTIKYLSKFKWDQLTEEINYLKASREQKIANEVSVAKREKDFYLSQVDKAKARKAQEQRRLKDIHQQPKLETEIKPTSSLVPLVGSCQGRLPKTALQKASFYSQRKPKREEPEAETGVMPHDVLLLIGGTGKNQKVRG